MDPINIIKRAWSILWSYRTLWVFGLILALTAGGVGGPPGSHGGNGGSNERQAQNGYGWLPSEDWETFKDEINRWYEAGTPPFDLTQQDFNGILTIVILVVVMILLTIIVFTIARYVAETALIRMVDEYERTGVKSSLRKGFRYGWSRSAWRLFLIDLVTGLPGFILILLLGLIGVLIYLAVDRFGETLIGPGVVAGIGAAFLIIFLVVLISVVLSLLRPFFWRVSVLDDVGVWVAFRRGFRMVWKNWKNAGLMWLIMIGLGIAYQVGFFIILILLIPFFFLSFLGGAVIGGIPTLLVAGISSLFLESFWPWVIGAIFGVPLFLLILILPALCITAFAKVFATSVWTLTYRELTNQGNGQSISERPDPETPMPETQ